MAHNASTVERSNPWIDACQPSFLHRLNHLRINVSGGTTQYPGTNPVASATQDSGLEFAKHRAYAHGDELRHIDWNALARHDAKLVRTFRAEREAPLHVLIDASASMAFPLHDNKFEAACALAVFLTYIALRNRDPVHAATLDGRGATMLAPLLRHPQRLPILTSALRSVAASGSTDLEAGITSYLGKTRLPGIAVVISDFLVERSMYERALHLLRASGYAVAVVRVIGEQERNPSAKMRRVRLFDVETRSEKIIDLNAQNRALYESALAEHDTALRAWCAANATPYSVIATDDAPDKAIVEALSRAGILC